MTVGLTDDEYAALLRLAADMKVRPNQAMAHCLRVFSNTMKRGDGIGGAEFRRGPAALARTAQSQLCPRDGVLSGAGQGSATKPDGEDK